LARRRKLYLAAGQRLKQLGAWNGLLPLYCSFKALEGSEDDFSCTSWTTNTVNDQNFWLFLSF
jgi:hypothetical protein